MSSRVKMSGEKVTIYEIAEEAGVSIATVSRVLNNPHRVNRVTREKILTVIDRHGFIPKAEARDRARKENGRIGVVIPFFTAPSFVQRLRGISYILSQENYEMVIYPVDTYSRMRSYLETLPLNRNLDGLIIVSQTFDEQIASRLIDNKLETVIIEFNNPQFCSLQIDDEAGGRLAAEYFIRKGRRNFAFVGGSDIPLFGHDPISNRLVGYQKRLEEEGYFLPDDLIYKIVPKPKSIIEDLVSKGLPLAIFAATDLQAIALLKEIRLLNLKVPQDLAIIGFDDIDMADYFGLTTVRQPLDESGSIAAEILLSRIKNSNRSVQHILLPLSIVERDTV